MNYSGPGKKNNAGSNLAVIYGVHYSGSVATKDPQWIKLEKFLFEGRGVRFTTSLLETSRRLESEFANLMKKFLDEFKYVLIDFGD